MSADRNTIQDIHRPALAMVDSIFDKFDHRKEIRQYGYKRIFDNGLWFDLLCNDLKSYPILRISRGARLTKQNPIFGALFDSMKVIWKMSIDYLDKSQMDNLYELIRYVFIIPKGTNYNY